MDDTSTKGGACLAAQPTPDRLLDEFLSEKLAAALGDLTRQAWGLDDAALEAVFRRVERLQHLRIALDSLAQGMVADVFTPSYLVSASFLHEAFDALTKTGDEHLVYATGPEDGKKLFALTRLVTFDLAEASVVGAAPDPASQLKALAELDRNGERLLATFHSHPGKGAGATAPSGVDLSTQEGLEKLGYPAIGVVFSRNGFVRFYAANRDFRVVVSGSGIESVEERLFRLADANPRALFCRRTQ